MDLRPSVMCELFVHDGEGPDVDPLTGDEAETEEPEPEGE